MKTYTHGRQRTLLAFTLIELLVVIAIIGLLAGMLLPAIGKAKVRAQVSRAQQEMNQLTTAVNAYLADYSVMPTTPGARSLGYDLTFGNVRTADAAPFLIANPGYVANNSQVIAILMDMTNNPNGTATVNTNHQSNPRRTSYLNAKFAQNAATAGGIADDGTYYDPWGNPYIISLDMDGDDTVLDSFFRLDCVSQDGTGSNKGFLGMYRSATVAGPNNFGARGHVMVWSLGPDRVAVTNAQARVNQNLDNPYEIK